MYNKLLISAGGGIIARDQQAEQNECATIAIGLGGTGVSCLRALKKEVYNRLKPDKEDSVVPEYRHIKFLAIDTDKSSLGDDGSIDSLDSNTEFLDLSCADISSLLAGAAVLKNKPSLQWLKAQATQSDGTGIEIQSAEAGAGGVRQIGRLLLYQNGTTLVQKLTNLITEAKRELSSGTEVNIHIFTGIGGGTGAGTYLDVCYLVQHVLKNLGIQGSSQTCGYFFLPDVNLDKVANPQIQEYIKSNGFAAMKELDYCMNFSVNGGEWNQVYDGFTIKTQEPPVKLAHLITATNANGVIGDNGYDYAMHVVVDYVMDFLIKPYISAGVNADDSPFTMKSHISNIRSLINMVRKEHGACYEYCVLGASNAYLPYKEITTYLTSKIFEGFERLDRQLPSDGDIDLFVQTSGLKYEDILKSLNANVPQIPLYDVDASTLYEQTMGLTPDVIPQVLGQMRDATSKISGKLAENRKAILDEYESITESGNNIASMIVRVKKNLLQMSAQPDKGPYYSGAILHNINAHDLQNRISGYIVQNNENISKARTDLSLREQSMANTLRELQNSGKVLSGRKKKAQNYIQAVNSYFRQTVKIEIYSILGDVLTAFNKQVSDLYSKFFGIYETVMKNLEVTFASNLIALAQPVTEENGYAVKLMSIEDLKDSLDESVKEMRIDDMISGFANEMLSHPEEWIAQDENKIAHMVSNYFLSQLKTFTGKTIVDYLKIKFDTTDPVILSKKVYDEIMLPLADKAAPMFWIDRSKYQIESSGNTGFCTIPEISEEIKAAADKYHTANNEMAIRPSFNTDRISFLLFKCGIPLFGYKGVDNYKDANRVVGAHLYEAAVGDDRDWRTLYDITPYSCINDVDEILKEKSDLIDKARELGVLSSKDIGNHQSEYMINIFDEALINELVQSVNDAIENGEVEKAKTILEEAKQKELPIVSTRIIKNVGASGCEEVALKDTIIASQVLLNLLSSELDKIARREEALKNLKDFINEGIKKGALAQTFAGAICTGVVTPLNDYTYVYAKKEFGVIENIELTTIDSQPYGEHLPLYSAYLGFKQLDEEVVNEIGSAIRDKKVNHKDEVSVAFEKTKELFSIENREKMLRYAKKSYPSEYKEIKVFLEDVVHEIDSSL